MDTGFTLIATTALLSTILHASYNFFACGNVLLIQYPRYQNLRTHSIVEVIRSITKFQIKTVDNVHDLLSAQTVPPIHAAQLENTEKTIEIVYDFECKHELLPWLLSDLYQILHTNSDVKYRLIADSLVKMVETVVENHMNDFSTKVIIVNENNEIILTVRNLIISIMPPLKTVVFYFNDSTKKLLEKYELKTDITRIDSLTKSAKKIN